MAGSDILTAELDLEPETTAVIVVDMQNDFVEEGAPIEAPMGREFAADLARFIDECRERGASIVFTKAVYRRNGCDWNRLGDLHVPESTERPLLEGSRGAEFYGPIEPHAEDVVVEKHRYSGFYNTDMEIVLRGLGIDHVVMTGVTTENCVAMTARDAQYRDYHVVLLPDMTGTFDYPDAGFGPRSGREVHETICTVMAYAVGTLATAGDVIQALDGDVVPPAAEPPEIEWTPE